MSTVELSALLLILIYIPTNFAQKLNVHVLYESLCPDSVKFINEQLYPSWEELGPYININFVPFGKSVSIENGLHFECQHGPKECLGNRIQSCALNYLENQNSQVEYVHCFMNLFKKKNDPDQFAQTCARNVGLEWETVKQCFESQLGITLQLDAEVVTSAIAPKFVPTILYDGKFNQRAQDDSQNNFRAVVCSYIAQTYPSVCKT